MKTNAKAKEGPFQERMTQTVSERKKKERWLFCAARTLRSMKAMGQRRGLDGRGNEAQGTERG